MSKKILITGGSGLIGFNLTQVLLKRGYQVSHLSRGNKKQTLGVTTYTWDVKNKEIDEKCLDGVDMIVHLAGAGIADRRWSIDRKKELVESRVDSINLIYSLMEKVKHHVSAVISASASGYYSDRGDEFLDESVLPKNDFLGRCCTCWEQAVNKGIDLGLRVVTLRTGTVLDRNNGAFPKLFLPINLGVGSPLGNGKQWVSWCHIEDVVRAYLFMIENNLEGAYNLAAPEPLRNKHFYKIIAKRSNKPFWAPSIPAFVVKLAFGEMSILLLGSTKMNVNKLIHAGFEYKYPSLDLALNKMLA